MCKNYAFPKQLMWNSSKCDSSNSEIKRTWENMSLALSIIIKFFSKNKTFFLKRFDVVVPLPLCKYCNEEARGWSKVKKKKMQMEWTRKRENVANVNWWTVRVLYENIVEMAVPFWCCSGTETTQKNVLMRITAAKKYVRTYQICMQCQLESSHIECVVVSYVHEECEVCMTEFATIE